MKSTNLSTEQAATVVIFGASGDLTQRKLVPALHSLVCREHLPSEIIDETDWQDFQKSSQDELEHQLTSLQYEVTQENSTEPAFKNEYWDNHREGIYVDIVSGEPLFSSLDKYESGTGWPSFTQPLVPENIVEKEDHSLFMARVEIRSKHADSHVGHVFEDGPEPTGLRYCMNSASLRFIPKEEMVANGYGEFLYIFDVE